MKAFDLEGLEKAQAENPTAYVEVLRERNMSLGFYRLFAADADPAPQDPHAEDEVYVVISGRGSVTVGDATWDVAHGAVVYVPAGVPHGFHTVTEDLSIVVVFSPPQT